jgi:hypothetical protein
MTNPQRDFQDSAGPSELQNAAAVLQQAAEALAVVMARTRLAPGADLVTIMQHLETTNRVTDTAELNLLEPLMSYNIGVVQGWIAGLSDPEYPGIGREFQSRVAQSGFTVALDPELACTASYISYSLTEDNPGFINTIKYGRYAAKDQGVLFNAAIHEHTHGLQKLACPALHASPYHAAASPQIVLCPESWLLLSEKCEQDAFAKQAWLNSLLAQQNLPMWDIASNGALCARDFQRYRHQAGDLSFGLRRAAEKSLTKSFYSDAPLGPYRFANYYHDVSLKQYTDAMNIRRDRLRQKDFIFVQLTPEDAHAVGQSFGPNVFGDDPHDPALLQGMPLLFGTPEHPQAGDRLRALNEKLGIQDKSRLPTLREALAGFGMTPEMFKAQSLRRSIPATPQPPAP